MMFIPETATSIASWVFIVIAILVVVAGGTLFFVGRRKRDREPDAAETEEPTDD